MHRRTLLHAIVLAPPLVLAAPGIAQATAPSATELDRLLLAVHEAGMPGLYGQARRGRRIDRLAAGFADVESARPVLPWFSHRIGSITKSFVATVVLQLAGERKLGLDDLVSRHLPQLNTGAVTVRMLLNHTSGIGNYTNALLQTYDDLVAVGTREYRPLELAQLGLSMPPTGAPGDSWSYSNTGYIVLGLLIERLTGKRYSHEIERRILRPLGLRRTYFPGNHPRIRGPHSKAYVPWPDGTLRDLSDYKMSWAWAAGEMVSTAQELTRFYDALFGGRLLRPDLLAQMRQTVPMVPEYPELAGYGLGIYWQAMPNGPAWGHDGGVIGQSTISWHNSTSLSFGMNMTFYDAPAIDQALFAFLTAAFAAGDSAAVSPLGRPIPQVSPLGRPIQQVHHLTDLRSPISAR